MRQQRLLAAGGFWLSDAFEADSIKRRQGNVTSLVLWLLALINCAMIQHDVDCRSKDTIRREFTSRLGNTWPGNNSPAGPTTSLSQPFKMGKNELIQFKCFLIRCAYS